MSVFGVIDGPNGITVFLNGKQHTVSSSDFRYDELARVFDDDNLSDEEKQEEFESILNQEVIDYLPEEFEEDDDDEGVTLYKGVVLHNALKQKVDSMVSAGMRDFGSFGKFVDNLVLNPSKSAIDELYDFLSYKELPLTSDGHFLAYKGVNPDFWSITGNVQTNVLQGQVDGHGRIYNGVGETIEVLRGCVDDNRSHACSEGAHAGSLDYARGFGKQVLVVKINPKDVVSVPTDCACQKLRTCKYEVVALYEEELTAPVISERDGNLYAESPRQKLVQAVEEIIADEKQYSIQMTLEQLASELDQTYGIEAPMGAILRVLDELTKEYDIKDEIKDTEIWLTD